MPQVTLLLLNKAIIAFKCCAAATAPMFAPSAVSEAQATDNSSTLVVVLPSTATGASWWLTGATNACKLWSVLPAAAPTPPPPPFPLSPPPYSLSAPAPSPFSPLYISNEKRINVFSRARIAHRGGGSCSSRRQRQQQHQQQQQQQRIQSPCVLNSFCARVSAHNARGHMCACMHQMSHLQR